MKGAKTKTLAKGQEEEPSEQMEEASHISNYMLQTLERVLVQ